MKKKLYLCKECKTSPKWSGQCANCKSWGSLEEGCGKFEGLERRALQNLKEIKTGQAQTLEIPIKELRYVLGESIVLGATILVGGDPGIGKSTLLLQLLILLSQTEACLYVSGEESVGQVSRRAKRICSSADLPELAVIDTGNVESITQAAASIEGLKVLVVDSVQTLFTKEIDSPPGSSSQIRATAQKLIHFAKEKEVCVFFVGHVTKDGQIAGPKILEHMVDTVLYFEGEQNYNFRILRSIKNRFGSVNEIGVFEMSAKGLVEAKNPSQIFLQQSQTQASGTALCASMEGSRAVIVEVQALVAKTGSQNPRRAVVGWDSTRLATLLAVLSVRASSDLTFHDVYVSISGGIKVSEPTADLGFAAAVLSAYSGKIISSGIAFCGEVCLSGEIRPAYQVERRVKEAKKVGLSSIVCNARVFAQEEIEIIRVTNVSDLLQIISRRV